MSNPVARLGPKHGIHLAESQARHIFSTHLHKNLHTFTPSEKGYNNCLYYATATDGAQYVIKVGGRFWTRIKTETEVAALEIVKRWTSVPVPKCVYWTSDKTEFGVELVVLEKCEGVVLSAIWGTLTKGQKWEVLTQLASHVSDLHARIPLPRSGTIGNLAIGDPHDIASSVRVDKTLSQLGSWTEYKTFLRDILDTNIASTLRNSVYLPLRDLLPRIDAFRTKVLGEDFIPSATSLAFIHGDLSDRNILVSVSDTVMGETKTDSDGHPILIPTPSSTLRITAILDWEWAGCFPPEEEYFMSFEFLKPDDDGSEGATEIRRREIEEINDHFLSLLEAQGVPTPRTIPAYAHKLVFNEVKEAVAPWWLEDLMDPEGEEARGKVEEARRNLVKWLEEAGC